MAQQNRLYVWDDRFLYLTGGIVSGLTQRHTLTLLVSLGDQGFELGTPRASGNGSPPPWWATRRRAPWTPAWSRCCR
ncbi:hypothetical protein [Alloalcanivorax marinus]|uniref:hypothetical protein n=1 Tax=Alloalcanivorax marinus TaxID=1177169 RepID=UPI001EF8B3AB|nr:hypothetical protein [Alloalcanivorax marinus]